MDWIILMEFSIFLFKCTINYNPNQTNAVGRTIIFASATALAIITAAVIGNVWMIPILNNDAFTA